MEVVTPIKVEIPSLRVLIEANLKEDEWIKTRYEQLNMIEEKAVNSYLSWTVISKENGKGFHWKLHPREFKTGDLVLKKILPNQDDPRGNGRLCMKGLILSNMPSQGVH